jgi:RNA polymerase sigma-70 factor (ECF subfamily)
VSDAGSGNAVTDAELRRQLTRAVRSICPAWLRDQVDDLVQTALVRLIEIRRREWGDRAFPPSYLYRTAYNAAVDEMRRAYRRHETALEGASLEGTESGTVQAPDRHLWALEIGRALTDCLVALERRRKLAVALYLDGCTVPELARALGWTEKVASHLVYRGVADLRECLGAKGVTP